MLKTNKLFNKSNKLMICLLSFVLIVFIGIHIVYAYLQWNSQEVSNKFSIAKTVDPIIEETFNNSVKSNVSVSVGETNYYVYVRATIVVNWKNADGHILATKPLLDKDYSLDFNLNDGWFEKDGFYYYSQPVESGGETSILMKECKQLQACSESGYNLNVQIIAQTIQVAGTTDSDNIPTVEKIWNVTVSDDNTLRK